MTGIASTYHRPDGAFRRLRVLAMAAVGTLGLALPGAVAHASTLVIEGAGDGHGVGMSQQGALGYAQHGFSDAQILAHYYTGTTLGSASAKAVVKVLEGARVAKVPIERYVRGVVAAEMPASWPMAALEAQAIASRTYALTDHAGGSRFDVYSDTRSQVYEGVAAETARTDAAVAATAGQIVEYAGKPAITYFFASSGGMTENVEDSFIGAQAEPWLRGVPDAYEGPSSQWKASLSFAAAGSRLGGLVKGSFRGIEVLARGASPRIVSARVLGSRGATNVSGPELASTFGLTSTWAYFSVRNGSKVKPEPDHSGQARFKPGAPEAPPPTPTPVSSPQGGTGSSASSASTGGAAAG